MELTKLRQQQGPQRSSYAWLIFGSQCNLVVCNLDFVNATQIFSKRTPWIGAVAVQDLVYRGAITFLHFFKCVVQNACWCTKIFGLTMPMHTATFLTTYFSTGDLYPQPPLKQAIGISNYHDNNIKYTYRWK